VGNGFAAQTIGKDYEALAVNQLLKSNCLKFINPSHHLLF